MQDFIQLCDSGFKCYEHKDKLGDSHFVVLSYDKHDKSPELKKSAVRSFRTSRFSCGVSNFSVLLAQRAWAQASRGLTK